jgi:chorismate mutase
MTIRTSLTDIGGTSLYLEAMELDRMWGVGLGSLMVAAASAIIAPVPGAHADDLNPLFGLVNAAAQRLQTAEPVAAVKWKTNGPIEDPPRVQQVLAAVTADARAHQIDPDYVGGAFSDQINATEAIEYTRFAQWKLEPASAPPAPPDLSASRTVIDGHNHVMVGEIAAHWDLLHSPACVMALDEAKNAVVGAQQLDSLYQQALTLATHNYCRF